MLKMILGCLVVLGGMLVSTGNGWAGWQRDAVCQGSCGGACGPCNSNNDREDRAESAYDQKVNRYNNLVDQASAAVKARNWEEAIRIANEALSVMDDSGLRKKIALWKSQLLVDQANRATDMSDRIDLVRRALASHEDPDVRAWLNQAQASLDARNLNAQGQSAYDSGDYARAERLFVQAQQTDPGDPAYAKNVRLAQGQMQLQHNQGQVKSSLSQLTDTINRTETASTATTSGLDFMPAGSAPADTGSGSHPDDATRAAIMTTPELPSTLDPMVVDARNVATGLPSSVETGIPHTPAGNRVRKGFQAIMNHDWQVARAWFKDALDHDPGNAGIERLIDLSEYTLDRKTDSRGTAADAGEQDAARMATLGHLEDDRMDEELQRALGDFNQNYLPKHPELAKPEQPASALPPATEQKANWQAFFDALFTKPPPKTRRPGSVGAVRD